MDKKINFKKITLSLLVVIFSMCVASCSRDQMDLTLPTDDGEWVKAEIIIREGHLHGTKFHGNPEFMRPILPVIQKVTITKTADGLEQTIDKGNTLKKDFKAVEVTAAPEYGVRYAMEIIYYDKNGKRINSNFANAEVRDTYQHFFTIDQYTNYATGKVTKKPEGEFFNSLHRYTYRDTDPEDKMVGEDGAVLDDSPVGLKGYFHFRENTIKFNMKISLRHFKDSKYINNGEADFARYPSKKAIEQSTEEIVVEVPFVVIGFNGNDTDEYFKELAEYYEVSEEEIEDYIFDAAVDPESSNFWM